MADYGLQPQTTPNESVAQMGQNILQNGLTTDNQQQLVQQAIERTKQAKMQTQLEQAGGLAAEKGLVPKAQAISSLRIALKNNGAEDDEIDSAIKDAQSTWPDPVSSAVVDRLVWALRPKTVTRLGEGNPFPATGSEVDAQGNPIAKGTMIQEVVDNEGNSTYLHSAVPSTVQAAEVKGESGQGEEKQWMELGKQLDTFTQSQRGKMTMNTIMRGKNALELLSENGDNPPSPILNQVYADIGSIMTGGVGTEFSAQEAAYKNALVDLNNKLGYYTGHYNMASTLWGKTFGGTPPLHDIIASLKKTLISLLQTTAAGVKSQLEAEEPTFRGLIEKNPQRWQDEIDQHMRILGAGLTPEMQGGIINPPNMPPGGAGTGAPAAPQGGAAPQKTPGGHTFTVEG